MAFLLGLRTSRFQRDGAPGGRSPVLAGAVRRDCKMLTRYREVFVGLLFGLAATAIDVVMHERMQDRSFAAELIHPDIGMLFYRVILVAFVAALGILLWKKTDSNRHSRN